MNLSDPAVSRRRFLKITGCGIALASLSTSGALAGAIDDLPLRRWTGTSLGAEAEILLYHRDAAEADHLIRLALAEVERLEQVFSLYRADSAIRTLNRTGELRDPPFELVQLLATSRQFSEITGGAFDVTVQPLWDLYESHFRQADADPAGPPAPAIAAAREQVDFRRVGLSLDRIALAGPGTAITLNGIAQGYITDRVTDVLRRNGLHNVLVDLGEFRALGPRANGRPWAIGIENPGRPGSVIKTVSMAGHALGTSGGYGTAFDPTGHFNHIFDPASGHCADRYACVSVMADTATTADALSTALSVMSPERLQSTVHELGSVSVVAVYPDGDVHVFGKPVDFVET